MFSLRAQKKSDGLLYEPLDLVANSLRGWVRSGGAYELNGVPAPRRIGFLPLEPLLGAVWHAQIRARLHFCGGSEVQKGNTAYELRDVAGDLQFSIPAGNAHGGTISERVHSRIDFQC